MCISVQQISLFDSNPQSDPGCYAERVRLSAKTPESFSYTPSWCLAQGLPPETGTMEHPHMRLASPGN